MSRFALRHHLVGFLVIASSAKDQKYSTTNSLNFKGYEEKVIMQSGKVVTNNSKL